MFTRVDDDSVPKTRFTPESQLPRSQINDKHDPRSQSDPHKPIDQPPEQTEDSKSKPKSKLSKPIIFVIICCVIALVVGIVVFFVVRSFKEESSNVRKQLETANETERMLKTKLSESGKQIESLNNVIKQQEFQLKFLGEEQEYKHQFKELAPIVDEDKIPVYEIDEVYDEMDPGAHKRKPDPRVEAKKEAKNIVNQKRETIEDQQIANKAILDKVQDEEDESVKQQLKQVIKDDEEDSEYDDDDVVMNIIQGSK